MEDASIVVVAGSSPGTAVADRLREKGGRARRFSTLEDLLRRYPLQNVGVLILHLDRVPKGTWLASIGRIALEYPCMQMIAVLDCSLPIVVAEFLTASGVKLTWTQPDAAGLEELLSAVGRMAECRTWCVSIRAS